MKFFPAHDNFAMNIFSNEFGKIFVDNNHSYKSSSHYKDLGQLSSLYVPKTTNASKLRD